MVRGGGGGTVLKYGVVRDGRGGGGGMWCLVVLFCCPFDSDNRSVSAYERDFTAFVAAGGLCTTFVVAGFLFVLVTTVVVTFDFEFRLRGRRDFEKPRLPWSDRWHTAISGSCVEHCGEVWTCAVAGDTNGVSIVVLDDRSV